MPIESFSREDFAHLSAPFKTEGFSRLYKLAPIRETYQVDLNWALPPLQSQYRKKPLHYLSWVIGHEGKGSLISYLRKKGWVHQSRQIFSLVLSQTSKILDPGVRDWPDIYCSLG